MGKKGFPSNGGDPHLGGDRGDNNMPREVS